MSQAIQDLMNEHRLIEQVLGSLETFAERLEKGEPADRDAVKRYGEFFRNFADQCHHGKEEDRLFVRMMDHGFSREYGPLAVMYAEHVEGRSHVRVLAETGSASGPLTEEERARVARHAKAYVPLLRAHIVKEDNVLYPMAIQALPAGVLDAMAQEFDAFERKVMGEGAHERFHALAESLIAAFPPDPVKMAAGSACMSCAGHM